MADAHAHEDGCRICGFVDASDEESVYQGKQWGAHTAGGIPGWVVVYTHRHIEGVWNLEPEESAELGPLLTRLTGVVRDAIGSELVYVLLLGENERHVHLMLIPRLESTPPEARGPALLGQAGKLVDAPEATRLAAVMREALAGSVPAGA